MLIINVSVLISQGGDVKLTIQTVTLDAIGLLYACRTFDIKTDGSGQQLGRHQSEKGTK